MEAQLTESSTFPAQAYAHSFFAKLPTDARFLQCTYQKIVPSTSQDSSTLIFCFEKYEAANIYLIQDTNLQVTITIKKADGTLPTKPVAPVNNFLHSLFHTIRLTINDVQLNVTPGLYHYKAYLSNCLTYGGSEKATHLECQGWHTDSAGQMGPVNANEGWKDRMQNFRVNYSPSQPYRSTGYTVFGRLMHDLVSCETGLPPGTKIKLELERNTAAFFLMSEKEDTEQYYVDLSNVCLYVPLAQLSQNVYNEINALYSSNPKEPQEVSIHFRKQEVKLISIPKGKSEFVTETLFPDSDLPCKIIVCFIPTKNKKGDYHLNPVITKSRLYPSEFSKFI
jgi:hypothetical protein